MTAIADQSTIADGLRGWLLIAAIAAIGAAVTVILALVAQPHNVPVMGDDLSTLDTWDRIGDQCRRTGHYYQLNPARDTYHCVNDGCTDTRHRNGQKVAS